MSIHPEQTKGIHIDPLGMPKQQRILKLDSIFVLYLKKKKQKLNPGRAQLWSK